MSNTVAFGVYAAWFICVWRYPHATAAVLAAVAALIVCALAVRCLWQAALAVWNARVADPPLLGRPFQPPRNFWE